MCNGFINLINLYFKPKAAWTSKTLISNSLNIQFFDMIGFWPNGGCFTKLFHWFTLAQIIVRTSTNGMEYSWMIPLTQFLSVGCGNWIFYPEHGTKKNIYHEYFWWVYFGIPYSRCYQQGCAVKNMICPLNTCWCMTMNALCERHVGVRAG